MTMVGMVLVIMQMLPFGDSVLGYTPYDNALRRDQRVWPFCPDDFAVSLGAVGAFGGEGSFNHLHADLLREAAAARNTAGANGTTFARPDTMTITKAYLPKQAELVAAIKGATIPRDPLLAAPDASSQILLIGMQIVSDADDTDGWTRLAGTQFRLVAWHGGASAGDEGGKVKLTGPPIDHYPVGYLLAVDLAVGEVPKWKFTAAPIRNGVTQVGKLLAAVDRNKISDIYWVYQLGQGEQPDYVVFRQVSTKEVPRCKPEMPALPKPAGATPAKAPEKTPAKAPEKTPAKAPEKTPAKAPEKTPAKAPAKK
jgi:hypothetical protein